MERVKLNKTRLNPKFTLTFVGFNAYLSLISITFSDTLCATLLLNYLFIRF